MAGAAEALRAVLAEIIADEPDLTASVAPKHRSEAALALDVVSPMSANVYETVPDDHGLTAAIRDDAVA